MRKLVAVCLLLGSSVAGAYGDGFCEGFEEGFKSGWCYGQGYGCVDPVPPVCPVPRVGEDSYQGGYNRGLVSGMSAKSRRGY